MISFINFFSKLLLYLFSSDEVNLLRNYVETGSIMTHFLEPSIRAPKNFVSVCPPVEPPSSSPNKEWAECLLRIVGISNVFSIEGSAHSPERKLALQLWGNECKKFMVYPFFCLSLHIDCKTIHRLLHLIASSLPS